MRRLLLFIIIVSLCKISAANEAKIDSLLQKLDQQNHTQQINTLQLLALEYRKSNLTKSIEYLNRAYSLSIIYDTMQKADIEYKLAYYYNRLGKVDSTNKFYSLALEGYYKQEDTMNIMKTSTMFSIVKKNMGDLVEAATLNKNAINLYYPYKSNHPDSKSITSNHLATMMTNYGLALVPLGQYDSALYYFTKSYEIRKERNASEKVVAKGLVNIGFAYLKGNKSKESIPYFEEAADIFISLKDSLNLLKCINNIGLANKNLGDTVTALRYYNWALEMCRLSNYEKGVAMTYINLSSLYKPNEFEKTKQALETAVNISTKIRNKQYLSHSLQNLSNLYFENSKYRKALEYATRAMEYADQTKEYESKKEISLLLSKIYKKLGDYKNSLTLHEAYSALNDSLFNVENARRFDLLQTQFETTKKEQEIASLKNQHELQRLENNMLKYDMNITIAIALIIVILISLITFIISIKRRKDKLIHRQKEMYHKKEKELAESELEKSKLKEKELNKSIQYKSKQLSTHALHMMQKNTMLGEIQRSLKEVSKSSNDEDKQRIKQINQLITGSLRSDNDWDVFKLYFEEINKDFYNKLDQISPELTTNDHRLCALIKLNMNSKEMANVLNVAPNSIKSSRYRLKKKLGLEVEDDLETYINNL